MDTYFRQIPVLIRFIVLMILTAIFFQCSNENSKPPNIILIMTDDQGYGDLACHGNTKIQTPNMDQLYNESIRLTNFHVSPTCAPTRAALLTGRYNNRTGVWHTITGRSIIREEEKTMANLFQQNGYSTAMFGKWHLGDNYPSRPIDKGFDEAVWHPGGGIGNTQGYWDNDYYDDYYRHNGVFEKYEGYCTDVWFQEASKFMETNREKPFFCYIATNTPHWPYFVEEEYIDPYRSDSLIPNPNFNGMITRIDENLGRLRKKLVELELDENTILIFMTDNGTAAGIRLDGHWRDSYPTNVGFNAGMRGKKGSPYDGGHRVPFFMRWPNGKLNTSVDFDGLAAHIDLLPTLADLVGITIPTEWQLDGMVLTDYLRGKKKWNYGNRKLTVDSQRKAVPDPGRLCAVMTDRWRWVNREELYDINVDPGQRKNVAKEFPEVCSDLDSNYEKWFADVFQNSDKKSFIALDLTPNTEIVLSSHDWNGTTLVDGTLSIDEDGEDRSVWNHIDVRKGLMKNGYWDIEVKEKSEYTFEMRRWPKETSLAIRGSIPASQNPIPGGMPFKQGKAINISAARLQIGDFNETIPVDQEKGIAFKVLLNPGTYQLRTWFQTDEDQQFGAYYVYVN